MSAPGDGLSLKRPVQAVILLLTDSRYFWLLGCLVLLGDAVLTQLIIRFVAYTEIDYSTYMRQVEVYLAGERDYSLLKGPSGPLVYPAGHVLVHRFLHFVTSGGTDMELSQQIYGLLYLSSQFLTIALYALAGGVPNWMLLLIPLSKRLHSIYVLRMFNDCWAIPLFLASVYMYGRGKFTPGSVLFSMALSIKMNILLYIPGLLVLFVRSRGIVSAVYNLAIIFAVQVAVATPFLQSHPREYLANAFEFSRVFLYKWTVNWRFVSEKTFLSRGFATSLLAFHALTLVAFGLSRWCRSDGGTYGVIKRALASPSRPAGLAKITPDEIITVLFTSNFIGIVFARSLHYQFYSWYAQQLPFLLFRTTYPAPLKILLLGSIEYAWNTFPSTTRSSSVLFAANLAVLGGVWFGHAQGLNASKPRRNYLASPPM